LAYRIGFTPIVGQAHKMFSLKSVQLLQIRASTPLPDGQVNMIGISNLTKSPTMTINPTMGQNLQDFSDLATDCSMYSD
jgi:hypothetical protein